MCTWHAIEDANRLVGCSCWKANAANSCFPGNLCLLNQKLSWQFIMSRVHAHISIDLLIKAASLTKLARLSSFHSAHTFLKWLTTKNYNLFILFFDYNNNNNNKNIVFIYKRLLLLLLLLLLFKAIVFPIDIFSNANHTNRNHLSWLISICGV